MITIVENTSSAALDAIRRLEELAFGAGIAAIVQAAARLGIPDAIDDDPVAVDELAAVVSADAHTLGRLMRALSTHEVFTQVSPGKYAHTDLSRLLRKDAEFGLVHLVLWIGAPWTWQAWQRLDDAVRTGKSVIPDIFGKDFFTYLREDAPEAQEAFNKAMTQTSRLTSDKVAKAIDLTGVNVVADIAGGQGNLLSTLLRLHPQVNGVLFELEAVLPSADPSLRDGGELADRATLVGGDCIREVPVRADLYILKSLLDWPDVNSITTLRNIAESADPGARVLVVDNLVDADVQEMKATTAKDLLLLLNVGGQMHTLRDFQDLFERANYSFGGIRSVPDTFPSLYLIEAIVPG
ncbi:MAG: methyltransferase [Pseudonocardiaceae bacterium]